MYHTAYHFVKDPMRAEDIMQEGFITAFEKLEQYQGGGTFWFQGKLPSRLPQKT